MSRARSLGRTVLLPMWTAIVVMFVAATPPSASQDVEWINPFLSPENGRWLVGAIGHIASEEERQSYLLLDDDGEAEAFQEAFWKTAGRQDAYAVFQRRYEEADRRFAEGVYPGGRSDRGTIFILYGEPESIGYEEFRDIDEQDVEIWRYPKKPERGLDGKKPKRTYRFVRDGDVTRRFDRGDKLDPSTQRRRRPRSSLPPFGAVER